MKNHIISVAVSPTEYQRIRQLAADWAKANRIAYSRGPVAAYVRELLAREVAKVEIPQTGGRA